MVQASRANIAAETAESVGARKTKSRLASRKVVEAIHLLDSVTAPTLQELGGDPCKVETTMTSGWRKRELVAQPAAKKESEDAQRQ